MYTFLFIYGPCIICEQSSFFFFSLNFILDYTGALFNNYIFFFFKYNAKKKNTFWRKKKTTFWFIGSFLFFKYSPYGSHFSKNCSHLLLSFFRMRIKWWQKEQKWVVIFVLWLLILVVWWSFQTCFLIMSFFFLKNNLNDEIVIWVDLIELVYEGRCK